MPPKNVFRALQKVIDEYGDEARRYINWKEVLKDPYIVKRGLFRSANQIAQDYLPGWGYESIEHYIQIQRVEWGEFRLAKEDAQRHHFTNWWIRSVLVPSKTDYLCELARGLRDRHEQLKEARRMGVKLPKELYWCDKLEHLLQQPGMAGRLIQRSRDNSYNVVTRQCMYRWSREVQTCREARAKGSVPSAWKIRSISYQGEDLVRQDQSILSRDLLDTHYMECWEWDESHPGPAPRRTSLTFTLPAGPMTWESPWRKRNYPIDTDTALS